MSAHSRDRFCRRIGQLLLAGMMAAAACGASAQSVESDSVTEKLSRRIHLELGKTTLAEVAAALSEQTGLKIEPADYLNDRIMVVRIQGVSARSALNALSELNDWRWK